MTPLLAFTFSIPMPPFVGLCCFAAMFLLGSGCAAIKRDSFFLGLGAIFGVVVGLIGLLIGGLVNEQMETTARLEARRMARQVARQEFRETQAGHLNAMPDDWVELHKFLKGIESLATRKAYVKDFLKDKNEPEISVGAFQAFYNTQGCAFSRDTCVRWRQELADVISPFVHIDVKKAMANIASSTGETK